MNARHCDAFSVRSGTNIVAFMPKQAPNYALRRHRVSTGANVRYMTIPLDVSFERTFSGTPKRIYQLLSEMGTSSDAVWPFASQPFMRSAGPLAVGQTEEWHLGLHAVLSDLEPEKRIVWRIDVDGVDGTHAFLIASEGKKTTVTHRLTATLSDTEGRLLWKRLEDGHERAIEGLFDKLGRVLKR